MGSLADLFVTVRPDVNKVPAVMGRSGQQAGRSFSEGFHSRVKSMVKGAVIGTLIAAGAAMGAALTKGFRRLDAIDAARGKLIGLGHSAKEVDKIMASALSAVKGTAFGLDEAATVAATAVAAGIKPGKELQQELRLVADAATIGGTSMGEMGHIFNQVATSNKVFNGTLNELETRGIPIVQLLADQMHVSKASVTDLAAAGKIDFATFEKALKKGVGGAALASGKTFQGAMKNMFAALSRLGAGLLGGVFPQLKEGLGGLTKLLDSMQPAANRAGAALGNMVRGARGLFDLFVKGDFTKNFHDAFNAPEDSKLVDRILTIREKMKELIVVAKTFFEALKGNVAGEGAGAPKWMTVIVNAGVVIGNTFRTIKRTVQDFWTRIWNPPTTVTEGPFKGAEVRVFSLRSTLVKLWRFIQTQVIPGLQILGQFILTVVIPAFVAWETFMAHQVMPIVAQLGGFFRDNIIPAFRAVVKFIMTQLVPGFLVIVDAVKSLLAVVIPIISEIVGAIVGQFIKMKPQLMDIWNSVKQIITGAMFIIKEVIQAVTFVIGGIWKRWGKDIKGVVVSVFKGLINIIGGVLKIIAGIINLFVSLVKGDWKGAWNAVKQIFSGVWQAIRGIARVATAGILAAWRLWLASLKKHWHDAWASIKKTGSDMIHSVKTTISDVLTQIKNRFNSGVDAIGKAWDRIKDKAKKPVQFVVWTVLNGGLIRAFNTIAKAVGVGSIPAIHLPQALAHAKGTSSVLPGYSPGRDVHQFFSPTGGRLNLSGGEGIARPEIVKQVGKKAWDKMNADAAHGKITAAMARVQSFAQGGSFFGGTRPVPGGWTHRHSGYGWARWAGDLQASMNTPVHAWKSGVIAAVRHLRTSYGNHIIENVGGARAYYAHLARAVVHAGQRVNQGQLIGYSDSTGNSTGPHLHFEIRGGNAAIGSAGGGGGGAIVQIIDYVKKLKNAIAGPMNKLKQIGSSPFAQMIKAAVGKLKDGMVSKVTKAMASMVAKASSGAGAGFTSAGGGSNRAIGKRMMLQRWNASNWPALNSLWTRESGWNTHALNKSSGAYGIPQALPASKMASAGSDWRNNPATQIKWGLGYIASRYGSPKAAWAHSQRTNWYGSGGIIDEPVLGFGTRSGQKYGFGEKGKELVTPLGRPGVVEGRDRNSRPLHIELDLGEELRYIIQGELDDRDEFHAGIGRMSRRG
jgi:murein DD-endopeptidase MepM/ murein hydrolase activator NlpD